MNWDPKSRRHFLKGLGGTVLYLPFLPSLWPERALAAATPAKRFIAAMQDNGLSPNMWYPSSAALNGLTTVAGRREKKLSDISGNISQILGAEFNALKPKLSLLRGIDLLPANTNGHQTASILGNNFGPKFTPEGKRGPTIDQVMGKSKTLYPVQLKTPSYVNLGVAFQQYEPWDEYTWDYDPNANNMIQKRPMYDPVTAFNNLFNGGAPPSNGPSPQDVLASKVVDRVFADYRALASHSRLGTEDKRRVQDHMDMVNDLQKKISATTPTMQCTVPGKPGVSFDNNSGAYGAERRGEHLDAHIDLIVAAVKCNLSKVFTLAMACPVDNGSLAYCGRNELWHDQSHNGMEQPGVVAVTTYLARKVASLMNKLNVVEDPTTGRTYLDNSIVAYINNHSDGSAHCYLDRPILLGGDGGGNLRPGYFVDYRDMSKPIEQNGFNSFAGRDHSQLLVTFLRSMGVPESEYQQKNVSPGFGDDTNSLARFGYVSDRRNPLPGLYIP